MVSFAFLAARMYILNDTTLEDWKDEDNSKIFRANFVDENLQLEAVTGVSYK